MNKLTSCEFNIDTACVELRYADGGGINIYCPGVEDSFDTTLSMRTEMDWLIYNAPLEYARMVLDGTLDGYLREASDRSAATQNSPDAQTSGLFLAHTWPCIEVRHYQRL